MATNTRYSDPALNSFSKTNLYYTNNNLLKYQDPTYLGFKLFFLFDQPESGLLSTIPHPNTAMAYLESIGETKRADYLFRFVTLLQRINSETPWFWQTLDGLNEAWKHGFGTPDFKAALTAEAKISIVTLDESIDLRMTALMDLYRKACFDWPNRREVVPRNLRFFNVSIYCYEARTINRTGGPGKPPRLQNLADLTKYAQKVAANKKSADTLLGKNPIEPGSNPLENIINPNDYTGDFVNDNISRIMFDLHYCEWLPDESGVIVESLSHKEMATKPQKLVFSYRNVTENNMYRMFSNSQVSDIFLSNMDAMALDDPFAYSPANPAGFSINGIENPLPGLMDPDFQSILAQSIISQSPLNSLLLGNVYGLSIANIAGAIQAGGIGAAAQIAAQEIGSNASKKNNTKDSVKNIGTFGSDSVSLTNE